MLNLWKGVLQRGKTIHLNYVAFSAKHKYIAAMATGGGVLTFSDLTAQCLSSRFVDNYTFDTRRTFALWIFGTFYYGIIGRSIYTVYEVMFGPKRAWAKAFMDIGPHTWMVLIPSFYFITGYAKGYDTAHITQQLRKEYLVSSSGTALYWLPVMYVSFKYCTVHTRILWITVFSFAHKTALSWYSNRERVKERSLMQEHKAETEPETQVYTVNRPDVLTKLNVQQA